MLLQGLLAATVLTVPVRDSISLRCTMSTTAFRQGPGYIATWVTATADTGVVGWGPIRRKIGDGHTARRARSDSLVRAQRFVLNGASWAGAGLVSAATEVWITAWDYDGACEPTLWLRSSQWAMVGSELFVVGRLRPRKHWVAGVPTIDTFYSTYEVYPPSSVRFRSDSAAAVDSAYVAWGAANPDALPAREVFRRIAGLPARCTWARDPVAASEAFRAFLAAQPASQDRSPWSFVIGWHAGRANDYELGLRSPELVQACGNFGVRRLRAIIGVIVVVLIGGVLVWMRRARQTAEKDAALAV